MRNRQFWACLMVASLLLIALAGCQNHDAPDPGSSQPGQPTVPPTGATQAPDAVTQAPNTEDVPDAEETLDTTEPSDNTEASENTSWIQGDWTFVARYDNVEGGEALSHVATVTYSFGADGTGSINEYGWIGRPGEEWEVAGMGFVETYFAYTLEGNTLTIIHTGDEFEEYPENRRHRLVYDVVRNSDSSISWFPEGGGEDRVYRKVAMDLTVEELLRIFGLESEAPES